MSSIDNRIVGMKFDNKQFESGIKSTLDALDKLKNGLKLGDAAKNVSKGFSLDSIAEGVDKISGRFGTLGAAWFTVVQSITRSAMDLGTRLFQSVWGPLNEGGKKRALNLQQAEFQFAGLGMDVDATMESALAAVKGTAFGLDEAAVAAANFGATGMRAGEEMTAALTGISGVAAMSGSSYSDVASIFGKVAGQGRLMGDDLNRLAARGINAAATLAKQMGITETQVREMVSEGKIHFNDFASSMNDAFGEHATKANELYSGSLANMRAALSRIGAAIHGPRLTNMRDIFNGLTPVIDDIGAALAPVNEALEEFGTMAAQRTVNFLEGLDTSYLPQIFESLTNSAKNLYDAFMSVANPIREAVASIFPPATKEQWLSFVEAIERFTESLILSETKVGYLKRTVAGLLAPFSILWEIIKAVGAVLKAIFDPILEMLGFTSGGVLAVTANFGDWLVALDKLVKKADLAKNAYEKVSGAMEPVIEFIRRIVAAIGDLIGTDVDGIFDAIGESFKTAGAAIKTLVSGPLDEVRALLEGPKQAFSEFGASAADAIDGVVESLQSFATEAKAGSADKITKGWDGLTRVGEVLVTVWDKIKETFSNVWDMVSGIGEAIGGALSSLWDAIKGALGKIDPNLATGTLNLGIVTGVVIALRQMVKDMGSNILGNISWSIAEFAETLKAMQWDIKAGALVKVAAAIAILAAALWIAAQVPSDRLVATSVALGAFLAAMVASLALMDKFVSSGAKVALLSATLVLLGGALLLFALAGQKFAKMDPQELITALVGLGGALAASNLAKGGKINAVALFALAAAFFTISKALQELQKVDWEALGKGGAVMAALMVVIIGLDKMKVNGANLINTAIAIGVLGGALYIMAQALKMFNGMEWDVIGDGLIKMGLTLLVLVAAMRAFPQAGMMAAAGAIAVVSLSMMLLTRSLEKFADFDKGDIAASLGMLAGSLAIIAGAMYLMTAALPGAAALLVVSAALIALMAPLNMLADLDGGKLGMMIAGLAAVLGTLALAGYLLIPAIPGLIGLGAAILLIGAGAALAGTGLLWVGMGLTAIGVAGMSLIPIIYALSETIPTFAAKLAEGFVSFMETVGELAPTLASAFESILLAIIDSLEVVVPEIIDLVVEMLEKLLVKIDEHMPQMIEAGMGILVSFLEGVAADMQAVVTAAGDIIVEFLKGIGNNMQDIIDEGANVLIEFLEGIGNNIGDIAEAGTDVALEFIEGVADNSVAFAEGAADVITDFANGLADAIREKAPELRKSGMNLAAAVVSGMTFGLSDKVADVAGSAWNLGKQAVRSARRAIDSNSPSKEFIKIGHDVDRGFAIGIDKYANVVSTSAENLGGEALYAVKKTMVDIAKAADSEFTGQPTIRPVLDLSGVRKDAKLVSSMFDAPKLNVGPSYDYAATAYLQPEDDNDARLREYEERQAAQITYNQYNSSPAALSEVDIYRKTKNQLSTLKGLIDNHDR